MSKSKLSNYKYQGALASWSSSVKKVLDIDGRFIDASRVSFIHTGLQPGGRSCVHQKTVSTVLLRLAMETVKTVSK
jgi:hypothetical protein